MKKQLTIINQLPYEHVYAEIGQRGFAKLAELLAWLRGKWKPGMVLPSEAAPPWEDPKCRYAPSIICRSEAELFGISTPRFAIRIYLPEGGFVNARRIATFCQQAQDWLALDGHIPRKNPKLTRKGQWLPWRAPSRELLRSHCIADSLLIVPERLRDDFRVLTARLGKAYGECCQRLDDRPEDQDFDASPYVHAIETGGGLCAQAVAFVATSLLHEHAEGVHGMAEVTAIASEPVDNRLILSGLTVDEIVSYFTDSRVGLQASIQKSQVGLSPEVAFRRALRCYLLSGFPVIVPVDWGRMQGRPSPHIPGDADTLKFHNVCHDNSIPPAWSRNLDRNEEQAHAILVVGCARSRTSNEVIFHDTGRFPFMRATAETLFECAAYVHTSEPPMSEIISGTFIPIVPGKVQMPLTNWLDSENEIESSDGVMQLADRLQNGSTHFPKTSLDSEFRLVPLKEASISSFLCSEVAVNPKILERTLEYVGSASEGRNQAPWVWLQWDANSAWVWDAQASGITSHVLEIKQAERYLRFAAWRELNGEVTWWREAESPPSRTSSRGVNEAQEKTALKDHPPSELAGPEEKDPKVHPELTAAVLSSYSVHGIHEMLNHWPEYEIPCEFYALMQADAEYLLESIEFDRRIRQQARQPDYLFTRLKNEPRSWRPRLQLHSWESPRPGSGLRGWFRSVRRMIARRKPLPRFPIPVPIVTAMERMADMCNNQEAIRETACRLLSHLASKNIQLIGLASFLPGLADSEIEYRRMQAQQSVRFLIRLAKQLKSKHARLSTIELVAGSLIYGICRVRDHEGRGEYWAWSLDPHTAIETLASSLFSLASEAAEAGVRLVIEYEPGPLYVLGNRPRLEYFVDLLETASRQDLAASIGLNCDIAHWGLLSGFHPSNLSIHLKQRIHHGHVSSHGRGHYGDAPLEAGAMRPLRSPSEFAPWIDLLKERGVSGGSGVVSLELEACKYKEMIAASITNLRRDFQVR